MKLAVRIALLAAVLLAGCPPRNRSAPAEPPAAAGLAPQRLRLVSVDDPQKLAEQIARQWTADGGGDMEVTYVDSATWPLESLGEGDRDLILYPARLQGDLLAAEWIAPLEIRDGDALHPLDRQQLLRLDRGFATQDADQTIAITLGTPLLVLAYRPDVLQAADLAPPQTWQQLTEVVRRLRELRPTWESEGRGLPTKFAEPLAESWAAEMLIVRAAASFAQTGRLSTVFDVGSMKPLIDSPPFATALQQMIEVHRGQASPPVTPAEAYRQLLEGEAALAITWLTSQADVERPDAETLAVAPLPGDDRRYQYRQAEWESNPNRQVLRAVVAPRAGRCASLMTSSRRIRSATRFAQWLASAQTNRQFSSRFADTLFVHKSQLAAAFDWFNPQIPREAMQQAIDAYAACHDDYLAIPGLRLREGIRYETMLAEAVRAAIAGTGNGQSELQEAAAAWEKLTDEIGRPQQLRLYQRSLGLDLDADAQRTAEPAGGL